jgi:SOS-response transcriptional repressor LexA
VSIIPISKIFEQELDSFHQRVLSVMKEDSFLSLREIVKALVKNYPNSPEVAKWKKRIGDIARYQVAHYLKTLERNNYVECKTGPPKKWRRLRQDSLLNEVVQAFVFEQRAGNRVEALKKLADAYILEHNNEFQLYVNAVRKARRIEEIKTQEFKKALIEARTVLGKLQS